MSNRLIGHDYMILSTRIVEHFFCSPSLRGTRVVLTKSKIAVYDINISSNPDIVLPYRP